MEPEPGTALRPEPPALSAPRRSPPTEGLALVATAALTLPAVVAETPRASAVSIALPSESSPEPPASQPQDAPSALQPSAITATAVSRVDPAPPPPATPAVHPARFPDPDMAPLEIQAAPVSRSEAKAGLLPGNPPANPALQAPMPASAAAPAPARELPAALAGTRSVPVLTLPQSVRPAASTMPEAATERDRHDYRGAARHRR
jgi:2-oxoglutarate dehydrogenase E2 component (dihydrolipoamide succinyltransferase)